MEFDPIDFTEIKNAPVPINMPNWKIEKVKKQSYEEEIEKYKDLKDDPNNNYLTVKIWGMTKNFDLLVDLNSENLKGIIKKDRITYKEESDKKLSSFAKKLISRKIIASVEEIEGDTVYFSSDRINKEMAEEIFKEYEVGQSLTGTIASINKGFVFLLLPHFITGLIPYSLLDDKPEKTREEVMKNFKMGQKLTVMIEQFDYVRKSIFCNLKKQIKYENEELFSKYAEGMRVTTNVIDIKNDHIIAVTEDGYLVECKRNVEVSIGDGVIVEITSKNYVELKMDGEIIDTDH